MDFPVQALPTVFSLTAVFCWGGSDFAGGFASKKSDSFAVCLMVQASGFLLMLIAILVAHAPMPSWTSILWALAAGAMGGTALAIFYRALANGSMGLTAPIAALVGAAIPTAYDLIAEGFPGLIPLAGFALAAIGIWLIARPDGEGGTSKGLGMALLAGVGFAGFMLCINRTGNSSALWSSLASRVSSMVILTTVVTARSAWRLDGTGAWLGVLAGCLDVTGTAFFIRAGQTGRLDSAVVISSLYPAVTVLLARLLLREHFTRWKMAGILAALAAVPLIAWQ